MPKDVFPTFDSSLCTVCVPVYNAKRYAESCVDSLLNADGQFPILIVDDGSEGKLGEKLRAKNPDRISLRVNEVNQGYTKTANQAIEAVETPYFILLNSDTEVPKGFVRDLINPMLSDATLAATGPLSNAASWQSVPKRFDHRGRWTVNPLPENMSVEEMASLIASLSSHTTPKVPLLNGFCMALRRSACDIVGKLDCDTFPTGYGEENDYCIRLNRAGFYCAVVDNCWVFHAKSKSFSYFRKKWHLLRSGGKLNKKWGTQVVNAMIRTMKDQPELARMRHAIDAALSDRIAR